MHGHRFRALESCAKCMQVRRSSTATAVKLKPRNWDVQATSSSATPTAKKWERPAPQAAASTPRKDWNQRVPQAPQAQYVQRSPVPRQPLSSAPAPKPEIRQPISDMVAKRRPWNERINATQPSDAQAGHAAPAPSVGTSSKNETNHQSAPHLAQVASTLEGTTKQEPQSQPAQQRSSAERTRQAEAQAKESYHSRKIEAQRAQGKGSKLGVLHDEKARDTQQPAAAPVKRKKEHKALKPKKYKADLYIPTTCTVGQLAQLLHQRLSSLQRTMKRAGMEDDMSYDHVLTADYAALLAEEYNYRPIFDDELGFNLFARPPHPDPTTLPTRPPIVTIMGHVDHGKTTLLDTLRSTAVAKGEAGGITQHIGAFSVPVPGGSGSITFLDTPGHAAFSAMRARGAQVTDIIVLVVAADDGVMPQTREVLELIKKDENVSVIVAVNKVDKPGADADKVKRALMAEGLELEDFGGEIPSVEVSGLTGKNLPALVETLSAVAEMKDIRAERDGDVNGFVLEAKVSKGLGSVATVLVTRGCLKPGNHIIAGCANAKVRSMSDSAGKPVKEAYPGMAVTVSGWKHLPTAGDEVIEGSESDIKKALSNRERKADQDSSVRDVDAINEARRLERERRQLEEQAEDAGKVFVAQDAPKGPMKVKLLIKADVSGSAEAVSGALHNLGNDAVKSQVISAGVGDVSESDILTAKAAKASVVAFSVKVPKAMELLAHREGVPIMSSPIIYRLVDSVTDAVRDKLPKVVSTTITGEANVLQIFEVTSKGKTKHIAGSRVTMGLMQKRHKARVMRNGEVVYEGNLETMRVLKNDVTEIRKGSECGLALDCADLKPGDTIQCFTIEESLAEL